MSSFAEVLRLWGLLILCMVNYGTNTAHAVRVARSNLKTCSEKPLEIREEMANVVLSGYIDRVMRQPRQMTYDCEVQVVRVFKGRSTLDNEVSPAMTGNKVKIGGFGDPVICDNVVHPGDTRVMLLNKDPSNGHLKLNSSLIRITLGNLDRAEAAVSDIPYITRVPVTEGPCSTHLCAFGAMCQESEQGRALCVCPDECTDVFSPVCGNDDITYINECYLKAASCSQMKRITVEMEGPCDSSNLCDTVECSYGAECMLTPDRTMAKCVCPQDCEEEALNPICGSDGVDYMNDCELRRVSCLERWEIDVIYDGKCDPCEDVEFDGAICKLDPQRRASASCFSTCEDEDVSPVCASDGNTYDNDCAMQRAACIRGVELSVYKLGECDPGAHPCETFLCEFGECLVDDNGEPSCICGPECPEVYKPVCGSDGMSYNSMCHLVAHSCNTKTYIEVVDMSPCAQNIEDPCSKAVCLYGAMCMVENGVAVCTCDLMCSLDVAPVCGSDGMTYANACQLKQVACEQQESVVVEYEGPCETCDSTSCEFGAICEMSSLGPQCVCPEECVPFESPICGSDGITYDNECQLNVKACMLQEEIYVVSQGTCDECDGVVCEFGSMCNRGSCMCPTCSDIYDPVCGTDMETYNSPCHLQAAMCNQRNKISVLYVGECEGNEEISGSGLGSGGDLEGSGVLPITEQCDETKCGFGGMCIELPNGMSYCSCSMNCSATRKPVCGSDLVTYGSECIMREASCEQQIVLSVVSFASCEDVEMEPCDGDMPLTDAEGAEYTCSEEVDEPGCPSGSYCHIHPMGKFSVCCPEQTTPPTCEDSTYGCCPDGFTAAQGRNDAGCPSMCDCHELGSYSPICEPVSQQCPCKPGVGGKKCDRCEPGFWDFRGIDKGNIGCRPCACSKGGSVRDDCEQMFGQCICKPDVMGSKCDVCPGNMVMSSTGCKEGEGPEEPGTTCEETGCPFNADCQLVEGEPTCTCPSECPPAFRPVCGTDGQTYASECQLRLFSCRLQKDMMIQSQGTCETSIQTPTMEPVDCTTSEFGCCPDGVSEAMSQGGGGCPTSMPGVSTPIPILDTTTDISATMITPPSTEEPDMEMGATPELTDVTYIGTTNIMDTERGTTDIMDMDTERGMTDIMDLDTEHGMTDIMDMDTERGTTDIMDMDTERGVTDIMDMGTERGTTDSMDTEQITTESLSTDNQTAPADLRNDTTDTMMMTPTGQTVPSLTTEAALTTTRVLETFTTVASTTEEPPINVLGCASDPCLHGGTCIDHDDIPGFLCSCPIGKGGPVCEQEVTFDLPSFMGRSYLAFPKMVAYFDVEIVMEFKTEDENDALLLWNGQESSTSKDFISLAIVNRSVEFRFNLGTEEPVIIRSNVLIRPHMMHRVKASRERREGSLSVDEEPEIDGESVGRSSGLSLTTDLHMGGGPPEMKEKISSQTSVDEGLKGCIRDLEVNGAPFMLMYPGGDILYGANVGECDADPCLMNPCLNNGTCEALSATDYMCLCINNFIGPLCGDVLADQCEGHMCHHTATCVPLPEGGYRCDCPMGRKGELCDKVMEMDFIPAFAGNSYIELPSMEGPDALTLELEFLSKAPNGMLFYNGDSAEVDGDFISLNLKDGFLEYRYDLGSGPSEIRSADRVSLQEWHTVEVTRIGKDGMMIINDGEPVTGESQGVSTELNLERSLFLGGTNNFTELSRKAGITDGFQGGMRNLAINNRAMYDFVKRAINEVNIVEYVDDACIGKPCMETYNCRAIGNEYECVCPENYQDLGNQCVIEDGSGEGSGGENGMFDEDIVTDEMIPDSTRRASAPGELTKAVEKSTPRMSSAQIIMSTQMPHKMSTGRKTTAKGTTMRETTAKGTTMRETTAKGTTMRETTPRQTTRLVTTPQPTDLMTTAPIEGMTTAPSVNIDGPVFLDGSKFYSYPNIATQTKKAQMANMIEVTFRTRDYDGMLLYNGVGPAPKMGDFIFIAVYKGELILGFNLGAGFKKIESPLFVSDDNWHTIKVTRTQRDASVQVDQEEPIRGSSKPGASQLNTDGVLWIGGYENYPENVYENYRNTFEGCIKDVKLDENSLHLYHNALEEQPTEFCPDD